MGSDVAEPSVLLLGQLFFDVLPRLFQDFIHIYVDPHIRSVSKICVQIAVFTLSDAA